MNKYTDEKLAKILSLHRYQRYFFIGTTASCFDDGECTVNSLLQFPYSDVTDAYQHLLDDSGELKKELKISKQEFFFYCYTEESHIVLFNSLDTEFAYDPVRDVYIMYDANKDMLYFFIHIKIPKRS